MLPAPSLASETIELVVAGSYPEKPNQLPGNVADHAPSSLPA